MRNSAHSIHVVRMSMVVRARIPRVTTVQEAFSMRVCISSSMENARTVARPRMASSTRRARSAMAARSRA